jgi:hypothetical protein
MVAAAIGVSAAAGLAGSAMSSSAASDAADTQAASADKAQQLQWQQFQALQKNLQPYMDLGSSSIPALHDLLNNGALSPNFSFDASKLDQTPGYQFTLNQGIKALNNQSSAQGLGQSGAQQKGLAQYATGLADQTYNQQYNNALQSFMTNYGISSDQYNRLAGLVGLGQNAAAGVGNAGIQTGTNIGNLLTGAGNAQAAGQIGSANAISGGLQGLGNSGLLYSLLSGQGGGVSPGIYGNFVNNANQNGFGDAFTNMSDPAYG